MKHAKRRKIRNLIAILFTILLMFAVSVPCAEAESSEGNQVIRVAFPQLDGYTMTSADGEKYGLVVDFLNEIAKYTGWHYEYIDIEDSNDILTRFEAGEFDLMGGQYYIEGLEEYYSYPEYNCGYGKLNLWARQNDETVKSYDLNSFDGKVIGIYERAVENIRRLKIYLELNDLDCTLKYYTYDQLMETGNLNHYLENGEVDLLLGNGVDAGKKLHVVAAFDSQPHYLVTQLGNQEILDGLNMALEKIYEADPEFAYKTYEANFPASVSSKLILNEKEKEYVSRKGTVTVAVPYEWHPLFCLNNDDGHDGFVPDILEQVAGYSGLSFSYLYCDSYADAIAKLEQGEADLLGFYLGTSDEAQQQNFALTVPYTVLNLMLVRNKESSYPATRLKGAVLEGRNLPDNVTVDKRLYYTDAKSALSDVNSGKADFFYGVSSHMESVLQQSNFTNLVQVNMATESQDISFALNCPVQPELFSILNKAIGSMGGEEKTTISNRNMVSIGKSPMTLSGIVYANPALAISVVAVVLLLILVVVIIVSRSRIHAAAMRSELARAEADNRAKSEFLSRMSHEIRTPMNAVVGLTDLVEMTDGLPEKAKQNLDKIKSSTKYLLSLINDILDVSRIENGKMEIAHASFSLCALLHDIENMMTQEAKNKNIAFHMQKEIKNDVLVGDAVRLRQVILNLLSNAIKFTPSGRSVTIEITEDSATETDATFTIRVIDQGIGIAEEDQQRIFESFEQLGSDYSKSQGTGLGLAISKSIVQLMGGELKLHSKKGEGSKFFFAVTLPKGYLNEDIGSEKLNGVDSFEGAHILIAEDNDLNAEIVIELLQRKGADVSRAENGKIALGMFKESRMGYFDVILMDIMMPEMNGLETTEAIRALSRPDAQTVPIIAMTANAFKEDEEQAMRSGMSGFISKPIDVAYLYEKLGEAFDSLWNRKE